MNTCQMLTDGPAERKYSEEKEKQIAAARQNYNKATHSDTALPTSTTSVNVTVKTRSVNSLESVGRDLFNNSCIALVGFLNPLNYVLPENKALSIIHGVVSDTAINRILPSPVAHLDSGEYTVYSMSVCYTNIEEVHTYRGVEMQKQSMVHCFTVYVDSNDCAVVTEDIITVCAP